MRRLALASFVALLVAASFLASSTYWRAGSDDRATAGQVGMGRAVIKVLHAGSLSLPLEEVRKAYERENPSVEVRLEASGSVEAIRKVTDLGEEADVVISADSNLLASMMFPEHAGWYVVFAGNELVLAYTERSKHTGEVNESNWHSLLLREDVRVGFSDPNRDPCGYRAVMAILLAKELYGSPLDSLLTEIGVEVDGTEARVPDPIGGSGRVMIRPKSVELLSLLELGVLDYAFEYKSVAIQYGLRYVELPPEVSFSSPELSSSYSRAVVHLTGIGRAVRGDVITYALTVPRASEREAAMSFVRFLLTEGLKAFESHGHPVMRPPIGFGEVPIELRDLVEVRG